MMMYMRFPEGRTKALTFSYDDGVEQDIRLMEIFNKNKLKGTFNLNGSNLIPEDREYAPGQFQRPLGHKRALEAYGGELGKNHEIALHCYTHPFLDRLHENMATYEVMKDREFLENMFGRIVRGCAYPMGTTNDMAAKVLRTCGVAYARTVVSKHDFAIPTDWLKMNATCHHNDPELFNLADKFLSGTPDYWNTPWLFYVWGHAYEFDIAQNWDRIEQFCEKMSGHDDVWYATNIEIYDYVQAYNSLLFSVEGKIVKNPSAIPVWFSYADMEIKVEPGETKKFR